MRLITEKRTREVYKKLMPFLRTNRPGYKRARPANSGATFRWMNPKRAQGYRMISFEEFLEVYGMVLTQDGYVYVSGDLPWFLQKQAV